MHVFTKLGLCSHTIVQCTQSETFAINSMMVNLFLAQPVSTTPLGGYSIVNLTSAIASTHISNYALETASQAACQACVVQNIQSLCID